MPAWICLLLIALAPARAAEHQVSIENGLLPQNLLVEAGDQVHLINRGPVDVTVTLLRFEPFPDCRAKRLGRSWLDPFVIKSGGSAKLCFGEAGPLSYVVRYAGQTPADTDFIGQIIVGEKN